MGSILPQYGTYVLILSLRRRKRLSIGKLGRFDFPPGYYAYVGSAFGAGGLAARLEHHLAISSNPHWHIDYLRTAARPLELWVSDEWAKHEHTWAGLMNQLPGASRPAPRFGSSDCSCASHLFHFTHAPTLRPFARLVRTCHPGSDCIRRFRL